MSGLPRFPSLRFLAAGAVARNRHLPAIANNPDINHELVTEALEGVALLGFENQFAHILDVHSRFAAQRAGNSAIDATQLHLHLLAIKELVVAVRKGKWGIHRVANLDAYNGMISSLQSLMQIMFSWHEISSDNDMLATWTNIVAEFGNEFDYSLGKGDTSQEKFG
jgi:hypothetical protein